MAKNKEVKPQPTGQELEIAKAEQEFKREVAITQAKPVLKTVAFMIWVAIDVVLVAIFVVTIAWYLVAGSFADRRAVSQIGENIDTTHAVTESNAAVDVQIGDSRVFAVEDGEYDFYATLTNPNEDWYGEFTYYFDTSLGSTDREPGFVLPQDERPIVLFSQNYESTPSNVQLVVEDLVWRRVDHHAIENLEAWLDEHDDFMVQDATYTFSEVQIDNEPIARTSFEISNASPYGYWSPQFLVILERAGSVVAVNATTINGYAPADVRTIDVNWFGNVPSAATVRVEHNINFFDESVYMSERTGLENDLRDIYIEQ